MASLAMAAEAPRLDPVTEARPAEVPMVATAMPPGTWPTQREKAVNRSEVMPDWPAIVPSAMNRGMTMKA